MSQGLRRRAFLAQSGRAALGISPPVTERHRIRPVAAGAWKALMADLEEEIPLVHHRSDRPEACRCVPPDDGRPSRDASPTGEGRRRSRGLGWELTDQGDIIQHGGDNPGFRAFAAASVTGRFGLVVMTNGNNGGALSGRFFATTLKRLRATGG